MEKIPTLFMRNYETDRLVRDEVTPGCEWVLAGQGEATRKWDGTCCMVRDGVLYKRFDAKHGKAPPPGFDPAQPAPDTNTGHWPGWLAVGAGPVDRWHRDAFDSMRDNMRKRGRLPVQGTYELCGPKINGNPEGFATHVLVPHGKVVLFAPRTFNELRDWLAGVDVEGVVWHHTDGRMAKIKMRDFGLRRE